jgi:hypothetical protein
MYTCPCVEGAENRIEFAETSRPFGTRIFNPVVSSDTGAVSCP